MANNLDNVVAYYRLRDTLVVRVCTPTEQVAVYAGDALYLRQMSGSQCRVTVSRRPGLPAEAFDVDMLIETRVVERDGVAVVEWRVIESAPGTTHNHAEWSALNEAIVTVHPQPEIMDAGLFDALLTR